MARKSHHHSDASPARGRNSAPRRGPNKWTTSRGHAAYEVLGHAVLCHALIVHIYDEHVFDIIDFRMHLSRYSI